MTLLSRLKKRQDRGEAIRVAMAGAGLIGTGIIRQVRLTPSMRCPLIVSRTIEHAVDAYVKAGVAAGDIVVSDDITELGRAVEEERPAITRRVEALRELAAIDVVVEATGAVEYGAKVALHAIESGKHIVMMNAETDATVGCLLKHKADEAGVVYTNSDGDQPGVLKRLVDHVQCMGFEVVAAVNCKGFMDAYATPESIRPWAEKQGTSLPMTTAFTDGTKMNIENAVLCNATGLVPEIRGMHGVETSLATALDDCTKVFGRRGLVDYTLGGDFGGGVFVIGHGDDPEMVQPYMQYLKMGKGPNYLFFRPYHLCHMETPLSIAEAVLDGEPTIAPLGNPVTEVIAVAKRDLPAGTSLEGIGGRDCYGRIDTAAAAASFLPVGLAEGAILTRAVSRDEPIPAEAVELERGAVIVRLRREQDRMPSTTSRQAA
ncbi:MAG: hypothetical protein JSV91_01690 [Phycisphaerales bacterium]|nr:MAG: hypothetical protein JSV91_01690 [Phycisphaerales bacterium]